MPDREKVVKGLEQFKSDFKPFCGNSADWKRVDDAIVLLKEQEPKPIIEVEDDDLYAWSTEDVSYYCPRPECGKEISYNYKFCPYCGQAVTWE